jgi:hypothetical protein
MQDYVALYTYSPSGETEMYTERHLRRDNTEGYVAL